MNDTVKEGYYLFVFALDNWQEGNIIFKLINK